MKKKNRKKKRIKTKYQRWKEYGSLYNGDCENCGKTILFYFYRYDADCCLSCNRWITKNCGDPKCMYCANRPDTPLEALNIEMMMHSDGINVKEWRRDNYQHKSDGMERNVKRKILYEDIKELNEQK